MPRPGAPGVSAPPAANTRPAAAGLLYGQGMTLSPLTHYIHHSKYTQLLSIVIAAPGRGVVPLVQGARAHPSLQALVRPPTRNKKTYL